MKKHHVVILGLILAALGAQLFALLPVTANLVTAYVFYLLAIALLVFCAFALGAKGKSLLMEFPLFLKARNYLLATAAISIIVLLLENLKVFEVPFSLHLLVQVAAALLLGRQAVILLMGKTHIEEAGSRAEQAHKALASLTADVNALKSQTAGLPEEACGQVTQTLARVSDALRYADPVGSADTAGLDADIARNVAGLGAAVKAGKAEEALSLAAGIEAAIRERAERLKTSK